jgi:hypothetical protein
MLAWREREREGKGEERKTGIMFLLSDIYKEN